MLAVVAVVAVVAVDRQRRTEQGHFGMGSFVQVVAVLVHTVAHLQIISI